MKSRLSTLIVAVLLVHTSAFAENLVRSSVTIFGGRWQLSSDAETTLYSSSGVRAGMAYIGHGHTMQSPNLYQHRNPKGFGSLTSALTQTAPVSQPIPIGCSEASIVGQSFDSAYPASTSYGTAGPLCTTIGFNAFRYYDSAGPTSDDDKESPIILDLTGHGYRLTSARDGVRFDIRNDGKPIQIAWTEADSGNAMLVLDRNGNGTIDSGAELFGSRTPLNSGTVGPTGFHALAELDVNQDYLVDRYDAAWANLLLWTDRNHDGASTRDELQPLADSAITALEYDFRRVGREDKWGNDFRLMAHSRLGEERRSYYDVWLMTR
jgi:hypothetical protein